MLIFMKAIKFNTKQINQDSLSFALHPIGRLRIAAHGRTKIHITGEAYGDNIGCELNAEEFMALIIALVRVQNKINPNSEL